MPYYSETKTRPIVTSNIFNACAQTLTPVTSIVTDYSTTEWKNNPEHRQKPAVLSEALTSRFNSRSIAQTGIRTTVRNYNNYLCSTTNKRHNAVGKFSSTFAVHVGSPDNPQIPNVWQAIREKMENDELNLGGYIGEYKETAALFSSSAKYLANAWKLAHGRLPKGRRFTPHSVSAAWLNSQFAIKPLVSDMTDALTNLNNSAGKPIKRRFVSQSRDETNNENENGTYESKFMTSVSKRAVVYATRDPNHSHYDFGNPLEWVWEAIPFSFVVDWFIPVGNYIHGLNATRGYVGVHGYSIEVREWHHETKVKNVKTSTDYSFCDRPYVTSGRSMTRSIENTIPYAQLPRVKNPLSMTHVADAVALLHLLRK